ncbi:MAG TPA: sigma 54-interacting transcriptional regulator, partial [Vicinamibacterales bacterium]|nr:sigma 54-interacting transcriptional regulator [Vicinamibacterales bacterium]
MQSRRAGNLASATNAEPSGRSVIDRVVRAADRHWAPGWQLIEIAAVSGPDLACLVRQVVRELQALGFMTLRLTAQGRPQVRPEGAARHVALLAFDEDSESDIVRSMSLLSAGSARGHLVCRCVVRPADSLSSVVREAVPAWGCSRRVPAAGVVPTAFALSQVQRHFWAGRFGRAASASTMLGTSDDRIGWSGLLSWAAFDAGGLEQARRRLRGAVEVGRSRGACWAAILSRLRVDDSRPASVLSRRWLRAAPRDLALLAALASVQLAIAREHRRLVVRWCDAATRAGRRPGLTDSAARWLRSRLLEDRSAASVERQLVSSGRAGVLRWGHGRKRMRILHLVPGLLQVVHDAEDDAAALSSGCSWARTHAGARAVAVLAGSDGHIVAHDGWSKQRRGIVDTSDLAREAVHVVREPAGDPALVQVIAPVRYGGAIIGHVIGRGETEEAEAVEDAVQVLAALCGPSLRARLDVHDEPTDPSTLMPELIGRGPTMQAVRAAIRQAARTSFSVVIEGESGTGKELVARALHRLSDRRSGRFMAVNCAALTDDLVEAELFGFARGAFTGAMAARAGLFEEAHGGSLFLDEVSELSARAQAKLLRALQEREVRRLGENSARRVDVRVVAATNQPLREATRLGRFREDLLFRLAVVRIVLPPLRERPEDLPELAQAFWRRAIADVGKQVRLSREALSVLGGHDWPGNIRELQNVLAALAVEAPARGRLCGQHVRRHLANTSTGRAPVLSLDETRRRCERRAIAEALARHGG